MHDDSSKRFRSLFVLGKEDQSSGERLLSAFFLEEPDRVPVFELAVANRVVEEILGHYSGSISEEIEFSTKIGFDVVKTSIYWLPGLRREASSSGREFVVAGNIHNMDDLEETELPNPDDPRFYEPIELAIRATKNTRLGVYTGINACWEIRHCMKPADFLMSFYRDPRFLEKLTSVYSDFYARVVANLSHMNIDFIFITEDIAYYSGPFVHPDLLRRFIFPRYRMVMENSNLPFAFHSDGNILPILDDLIDLGFYAIHPVEPLAMDIAKVKEQYGNRICLIGNIDLRYTLPRGSPREVSEEVRTRIRQAASGGGYVVSSANSIPEYVPTANFLAMVDTAKKCGKYSREYF